MSNVLNFSFSQGSTFTITFPLQTDDGAPFNLTGFDARMQVRRTYGDTSTLINATLQNAKLSLGTPALGQVTFTVAPADTSSIRFNEREDDTLDCVYDLEVVSSIGQVYKPARGSITLLREVTR